jgi:hypothetical protein
MYSAAERLWGRHEAVALREKRVRVNIQQQGRRLSVRICRYFVPHPKPITFQGDGRLPTGLLVVDVIAILTTLAIRSAARNGFVTISSYRTHVSGQYHKHSISELTIPASIKICICCGLAFAV